MPLQIDSVNHYTARIVVPEKRIDRFDSVIRLPSDASSPTVVEAVDPAEISSYDNTGVSEVA